MTHPNTFIRKGIFKSLLLSILSIETSGWYRRKKYIKLIVLKISAKEEYFKHIFIISWLYGSVELKYGACLKYLMIF
jgi:hypothetical protein